MRSDYAIALFALAVVFASGCLDEEIGYTCPDGSIYSSPEYCPQPVQQKVYVNMTKEECDKQNTTDDVYACYTSVAVSSNNLSICDMMDDRVWLRFCYTKLNMSHLLGPEETSTTWVRRTGFTTTTQRTTTTTLICGNGKLDEGEECDIGTICQGDDGVCSIMLSKTNLATCLVNNTCDWNAQVAVTGAYDIGPCIGCYGPRTPAECTCIKTTILNETQTSFNGGDTTERTKTPTHMICVEGQCRVIQGAGDNDCSSTDQCRHHICAGFGNCVLVFSPGADSCSTNDACK